MPAPDSQRFYYLHNFERALAWLYARYPDVLRADETYFVQHFPSLPRPARALLVRMIMRRGPLFRSHRLRYDEIGCPFEACAPLVALGWLKVDPLIDFDQLFSLLLKPEALALFAEPESIVPPERAWALTRRAEMQARLRDVHTTAQSWRTWWPDAPDDVFEVCVADLCERLRLMFFGNLRQQWSEFVLTDLGVFRYEQVELTPATRAFQRARDVDDYLALHACRQAAHEGESLLVLAPILAELACDNDWLRMRRDRAWYVLGQRAERELAWSDALTCYRASAYPGARYRRLRVLERSDEVQQALDQAMAANDAPESEEESQRLARMLPRLQRRLGIERAPRPRSLSALDISTQYLPMPIDPLRVEAVVRQHLHTEQAPVFYVENALVNSLFGLLCWDAIFACVPGAFFHPFQSGPADLHRPGFRARREAWFGPLFAQLEGEQWRQTIRNTFESKRGIQSPYVHWGVMTPALLDLALTCVAGTHLRAWFDRLLSDPQANRTGWPDLIQFFPADRTYEMIEVKGPGDRLQDNQRRWLDYCLRHGMRVRVLHVAWVHEASVVQDA